jgi:signal transduction histidine kinase
VIGLVLAAVAACLLAWPAAALAVSLPPLPVDLPVPTPTVSLPVPGILPSGVVPSPGASPKPSPAPAAAGSPPALGDPSLAPGGAAVTPIGARTVSDPPPAQPAPLTGDSVIRSVVAAVPSQVPVFPILLPLVAGLVLLLASSLLAAYRRTQEAHRYALLERTKSDFMKLASHELRTPLTVLRGYISMIRDGDIKPATPGFDKALPIIEDRLNQVNTIVEQMLEAARLEDGKAILNLEQLDLADLASRSVDEARARTGAEHPIEYRPPVGTVPLLCDRTRVTAMLDQLLDNAVKYSPEGGEIECSLAQTDGRAVFTVRDSGIGIAPEDLGRLFTRFGRLVTRDNSHIPGAGLGLYLAREHARRMGGDITVESRPAVGSAFTLSLPLVAAPGPRPAPLRTRAAGPAQAGASTAGRGDVPPDKTPA